MDKRREDPGSDNNIKGSDIEGVENPLQAFGKNAKMADRKISYNHNNSDLDRSAYGRNNDVIQLCFVSSARALSHPTMYRAIRATRIPKIIVPAAYM